jgi:hypothetical protein
MINGTPVTYPRSAFDGILMNYQVVGDPALFLYFEKGRVAVHEVGHWLGLLHPYAGFCNGPGDLVADTPPQTNGTNNCPSFPVTDNCSLNYPGIMFMNYMDQSQDDCKYFFTNGQKDRARSFFAQNGPIGTRFPFLANYFGIKHFSSTPIIVQNNTITVNMQNPACLPTTYSFTGPVTEISHDNQKIVFSVQCPSNGTISLTATSGNYVDDYTFSFSNQSCITIPWPKSYAAWNDALVKDNYGNVFSYYSEGDIHSNINHNGVLPLGPGHVGVHYNIASGVTTWVKDGLTPIFALSSGDIQMLSRIDNITTSFYNSTTGQPSSSPPFIPANEKIIAEINNGGFITIGSATINVRLNFLSTSVAFIPLATSIFKTFFNPFNQRLFVEYRSGSGNALAVYQLTNNNLVLINSPALPGYVYSIVQIDNSDNVYVLNPITEQINLYNFMSNSYSPFNLLGFNNNTIFGTDFWGYYRNTEDRFLAVNYDITEKRIYLINPSLNQVKSIVYSISPSVPGYNFHFFDYVFDGNDLIFSAMVDLSQGQTILGPQVIPTFHYPSSFITKLNIADFNKPAQENILSSSNMFERDGNLVNNSPTDESEQIEIFPNPANALVTILSGKNSITDIKLSDMYNNVVLRKIFMGSKNINFSVSTLIPGVYYCSIKTNNGAVINKKIVVLR